MLHIQRLGKDDIEHHTQQKCLGPFSPLTTSGARRNLATFERPNPIFLPRSPSLICLRRTTMVYALSRWLTDRPKRARSTVLIVFLRQHILSVMKRPRTLRRGSPSPLMKTQRTEGGGRAEWSGAVARVINAGASIARP